MNKKVQNEVLQSNLSMFDASQSAQTQRLKRLAKQLSDSKETAPTAGMAKK